MDICCTLASGKYYYGAAALVNSLVRCGFQGEIVVGHSDALPAWWSTPTVPGITLTMLKVEPGCHLGYYKPAFVAHLIETRPDCERIVLADSDICFTGPWSFMQEWVDSGLAICSDVTFDFISPKHPWRKYWRQLIERCGLTVAHPEMNLYPNGGFTGAARKDFAFFSIWQRLTEGFAKSGVNMNSYYAMGSNAPIRGDQDLLAASLMVTPEEPAIIGAEAMGFRNYSMIMCHGVDHPKPWEDSPISLAIRGHRISNYHRVWLENLNSPIKPYSNLQLAWRRIDLVLAKFIARAWKR